MLIKLLTAKNAKLRSRKGRKANIMLFKLFATFAQNLNDLCG